MNFKATKSGSELQSLVGVYRSQPFEVASAAPLVLQPHNATASSSSHKSQLPPSSKQLSPPSSSAHKFKTDSKKKYPASSSGNPPMGQSQPSKQEQKNSTGKKKETKSTHGKNQLSKSKNPPAFETMGQSQPSHSKEQNRDRNKSKDQSATTKNPLAKLDKHNKLLQATRPLHSTGHNTQPKNKVPAPKGILQKAKPPPPLVTYDDNSSSLELTDSSSDFLRLPDDNFTSSTDINDNRTSLKPTHNGSTASKLKTPILLLVREQEESES
jgi:hypothetical protein